MRRNNVVRRSERPMLFWVFVALQCWMLGVFLALLLFFPLHSETRGYPLIFFERRGLSTLAAYMELERRPPGYCRAC